MKYVITAWLLPFGFFWGWYYLSLNDIHFGYVMLTRAAHDLIFQLYGDMLGIDPQIIPGLIAKATILDTSILLGIWAFRRRREIAAWWRRRQGREAGYAPEPVADPAPPSA